MIPSAPVIRLRGVSKTFDDAPPGTSPALDKIDAEIPSGEVVGLVGPDAAGKTTLMRLLAGLLLPSSGTVEVLGHEPDTTRASSEGLHDVGYMPQRFGLYEDLSVIDNLNLHAELRGLEGSEREAMFEKLLTFTDLKRFTSRLAGKLSGGMKQKLGLACALLTTPRLLLLDEPGVGVDPLSRRELWSMVSDLAGDGMSVLWSTAYMDEAEQCRHVLMLEEGRLVYQGTPLGFIERVAGRVFTCRPPAGAARRMLAHWQQESDVRDALIQGSRIRIVLAEEHGPLERNSVVLQPAEPRLEDAYIDAVGGMDRRPSPFLPKEDEGERGDVIAGGGGGTLSGERLSSSLPRTPSLLLPKTFVCGHQEESASQTGAAPNLLKAEDILTSSKLGDVLGESKAVGTSMGNLAEEPAEVPQSSFKSLAVGTVNTSEQADLTKVLGRDGGSGEGRTLFQKDCPSPDTPFLSLPAQSPVIRAVGLTKRFGSFVAAHDISFEVQPGRIFGLLGPNGAGKSTTFRMLCGLSTPTEGECFVAGMNLLTAGGEARARLGYMAQKFSLYGELTVQQNMLLMADLYGLPKRTSRQRVDELVGALDLEPFRNVRATQLPLGQKQRLGMACATLHGPSVLFLDEPTSGVDPRTRREFWKHINAMTQNGVAVLVTTHFMEEAEYCDEIALIFQGGVIARGTPDELKAGVADEAGTAERDITLEDAFIASIKRVQESA